MLVHEELEDGVSGHKVRAEKRDSIQHIKELALAKKFDILLVFMFDRIGRIADETPFVVEWLVKNGVRVWSVNEGEQRFDNHTDKLTNFIRYWQADGESVKTSMRVSGGLALLVESGHYKGGKPAYGYTLIKSGRLDKKGNERKNLAICEEEAAIVRKIFDLYVRYGHGVRKISYMLAEQGIKTRTGKNFQHTTIRSILQNLTYTGVLRSGESRSEVIIELQIITPELFEKTQDIMAKRSTEAADKRTIPMNTNSRCLLNGKVYCATCGSRLVVSTTGKYFTENGVKMRKLRYECHGKIRKAAECDGQTGYVSLKVDNAVDGMVRYIFSKMKGIPKSEVVNSGLSALQQEQESIYKAAQRKHTKAAADLAELKAEVLKAIRGESKFSPELLSELITGAEKGLAEVEAVRDTAKHELDGCKYRMKEMQAQYDEALTWTELYDVADFPAKKMIIANLINRIEVGTGYEINIDFNINLEHFKIDLNGYDYEQKETA